jgi:hypothetical protein
MQACQNQNCLGKLSIRSSSCCCAGGRRRMLWRRGLKRSLIQLSVSYTQLKALRHLAWCNGLPESKAWLDRGERSQDGHGQLEPDERKARPGQGGAHIAKRPHRCDPKVLVIRSSQGCLGSLGRVFRRSLATGMLSLYVDLNKNSCVQNQPVAPLLSGGRNEF